VSDPSASDVKLTLSLNGSIKVEGNVTLQDHEGNEVPTKTDKPFFLCRCGASTNKPFCDGSHNRVEFKGS
jgi:CDGSH-type Zn-finger protein